MTPEAIIAKNKLDDGGLWLFLVKLFSPAQNLTLYITQNTSNVEWNGQVYSSFPFEIGEYRQAVKGELPSLQFRVSNVSRIMQGYIEADPDFGSGWNVDLYAIYEPSPPQDGTIVTTRPVELELQFESTGVSCDETWAIFNLGLQNPLKAQFPYRKLIPNNCQAIFKDATTGCNYTGGDTTCGYTLADCKAKFGNVPLPFLGFPGIPTGTGVFKI